MIFFSEANTKSKEIANTIFARTNFCAPSTARYSVYFRILNLLREMVLKLVRAKIYRYNVIFVNTCLYFLRITYLLSFLIWEICSDLFVISHLMIWMFKSIK